MENSEHYPISDLSFLFPELAPEEYERLVSSIRREGLLDPVTVWRGEVIDGRHRLAACAEAGVRPRYHHLPDDADPVQHVISRNAFRRHLSESQRAVVAHRLSSGSGPGRPPGGGENCAHLRNFSQGQAAQSLGVSRRLVTHASRVLSEDGPAVAELRRAVERGQVRVTDAGRLLEEAPEVQRRAVDLVAQAKARTLAGALRQVHREMALQQDEVHPEAAGGEITLHQAAVADLCPLVPPASVDAIITHPPQGEDALPLFSDLASFAAHALKPAGVMVVVGNGMLLKPILDRLHHPDLHWIGEFDLILHGPPSPSLTRVCKV